VGEGVTAVPPLLSLRILHLFKPQKSLFKKRTLLALFNLEYGTNYSFDYDVSIEFPLSEEDRVEEEKERRQREGVSEGWGFFFFFFFLKGKVFV
jgi:hypothetical protein